LKYAHYVGIAAALLLVAACFIPWAYYPDIRENFTGFYSKQNNYGKPGKTFIFLSIVAIILFLIPKIGAKWANQVLGVVIFAYALKTYILFSSCYNTICPQVKAGLIGMMGFSTLILVCALLSKADMKLKEQG
jgi:hypothetical protein